MQFVMNLKVLLVQERFHLKHIVKLRMKDPPLIALLLLKTKYVRCLCSLLIFHSFAYFVSSEYKF